MPPQQTTNPAIWKIEDWNTLPENNAAVEECTYRIPEPDIDFGVIKYCPREPCISLPENISSVEECTYMSIEPDMDFGIMKYLN